MSSLSSKQPRLKHLAKLRVKSTAAKTAGGPCSVALTNLLSCWASNGHDAPTCANFAQELKICMATRPTVKAGKSSINYHAARLKDKVSPPPYD
ncbi:mitochondrial 37S ribosomal protein mS37 [Magnusiomyces paraingens]|uniref:37S ribosomal protein mrp10, mitochondrial n=1 Tax=Magnusiomyces paraingens TaxID=2606893 RepID=A0A5E8B6X1_9ASCO|nr:uncharacterized protein SAPINGB_P001677 [Saprochaete ingens]VVT47370.1 unnamed protein product [Saprochaete ingens]